MPTIAELAAADGIKPLEDPLQDPNDLGSIYQDLNDDKTPESGKSIAELAAMDGIKPEPQVVDETKPAKIDLDTDKGKTVTKADAYNKIIEDMTTESQELMKIPVGDPQGDKLKDEWMKKWTQVQGDKRQDELARKLTFGFGTMSGERWGKNPQVNRRIQQGIMGLGATIAGSFARLGNEDEAAGYYAQLNNDLGEYNNLLDRKTNYDLGPLVGDVIASLTSSSIATASTGGVLGMASVNGLETFEREMLAGKDLDPKERVVHAATAATIETGLTVAGGALAGKADVASGETIIPLVSKAASKLFTRTGLMKTATAALIEFGEEGGISLLSDLEAYRAGTNPDALETMWSDALTAGSTGMFVSSSIQATKGAGQYDLKTKHFNDVVRGWIDRLPKKTKTRTKPVEKTDPKTGQKSYVMESDHAQTEAAAKPEVPGYVEGKAGIPIRKSELNKEVEALRLLEEEVVAQRATGGAVELEQLMHERTVDLANVDKEIKELETKQSKHAAFGKEHANTNERIKILTGYRKEIRKAVRKDKADLAQWKKGYEDTYKQERAFIDEELAQLTKLQEKPDITEKILDSLTKPAEKKVDAKTDTKAEAKPEEANPEMTNETGAVKPTEKAPHPQRKAQTGIAQPMVDGMKRSMMRSRQEDMNKVREFFGRDKVDQRTERSDVFEQAEAVRLEYDKAAMDIATESLNKGTIIDSTRRAGLELAYFDKLREAVVHSKFLEDTPDIGNDAFDNRTRQIDRLKDEIDTLGMAMFKSASEAGATLRAQQRYIGKLVTPGIAKMRGKRNKGSDLTKKEEQVLTDTALAVQKASEDLVGLERGSKEFDRADENLWLAELDHKGAIANLKPSNMVMGIVEKANAIGMARTLGGDLVPHGRQLYDVQFTNPKVVAKGVKSFYKTLMNLSVKDAETEAFKVERGIREMENFYVLNKTFGVPLKNRDTPHSEVEGNSMSRIRQSYGGLKSIPGEQFDIAYRTILNQARFEACDYAYRANKDLMDLPGGKEEMQAIIHFTLNTTGHTKADMGPFGRVTITSPRYLLSRFAVPAKGVYHMARGALSAANLGKRQHASEYIARKYATILGGHIVYQGMMKGIAAVLLGTAAVDWEWNDLNPWSRTAGKMRAGGMTYDSGGGHAKFFRQASDVAGGAKEMWEGDDKIRDPSFIRTVGSIGYSASPVARAAAYLMGRGKPLGETEKITLAEYALRQATFLSWQTTYDVMKKDGFLPGVHATFMEQTGHSGNVSK